MTLQDQVCSLDSAKWLKELGVKQESLFWWVDEKITYRYWRGIEQYDNADGYENYGFSAFTVAEIGNLLPKKSIYTYSYIEDGYGYRVWSCTARYREASKNSHINTISGETEVEARAKMLIYLLENRLLAEREAKE